MDEINSVSSKEEFDFGIRYQALHMAQMIAGPGHTSALSLVEEAQILETYLREGRTPHPVPQQAKAA